MGCGTSAPKSAPKSVFEESISSLFSLLSKAFLDMDQDKSGLLTREEISRDFERLGVSHQSAMMVPNLMKNTEPGPYIIHPFLIHIYHIPLCIP